MSHKEDSQSLGRHSGVAADAPSPISVMKSNGAGGTTIPATEMQMVRSFLCRLERKTAQRGY